jgi:hypothetical protein
VTISPSGALADQCILRKIPLEAEIMFRLLLALGVIGTIFVLSPVRPPLTMPVPAALREQAVATAIDHAAAVATVLGPDQAAPPSRPRR